MSQLYKNPTKRVGLAQTGPNHLIEINIKIAELALNNNQSLTHAIINVGNIYYRDKDVDGM